MLSILPGIDRADLVAYIAIAVLFTTVAIAACMVPARRAATLNSGGPPSRVKPQSAFDRRPFSRELRHGVADSRQAV